MGSVFGHSAAIFLVGPIFEIFPPETIEMARNAGFI